jgi:hypothetical protein
MKKIPIYFLLSIILLSSCQKEFEPDPIIEFIWPEGTGDYAPYTVGSTFTYESVNLSTSTIDSFTYKVTKDTTIDNSKYYKLESNKPQIGPSPTYFVNYSNGKLTELTYGLNFLGVFTIPELSENTFRIYEPLNATWHEDLPRLTYLGIPVIVNFEYTITQKDYTKPVLYNNFANTTNVTEVVHIALGGGIPLPTGIPSTIVYDNFYAKGAGLIERDITLGTTQKLKHFHIVK